MTRVVSYNASLSRTLIKYRIEKKVNGRWIPVRLRGVIVPFDSIEQADKARAGLR